MDVNLFEYLFLSYILLREREKRKKMREKKEKSVKSGLMVTDFKYYVKCACMSHPKRMAVARPTNSSS
jgi:hypothetical protein